MQDENRFPGTRNGEKEHNNTEENKETKAALAEKTIQIIESLGVEANKQQNVWWMGKNKITK